MHRLLWGRAASLTKPPVFALVYSYQDSTCAAVIGTALSQSHLLLQQHNFESTVGMRKGNFLGWVEIHSVYFTKYKRKKQTTLKGPSGHPAHQSALQH
jgi:hypothetical protein